MFDRILVPTDGSPLGDAILPRIEELLRREDAELCLLAAVPTTAVPPGAVPPGIVSGEREMQVAVRGAAGHLETLRRRLEDRGVPARSEVVQGDPATEIVGLAERWDASLIAMSTHGRGGLTRFLRGSVAERVLRTARCPVLVCGPGPAGGGNAPFSRILVPLDGSERSDSILPLVESFARLHGAEVILHHAVPPPVSAVPFPDTPMWVASLDACRDVLEPRRRRLDRAGIRCRVRTDPGPASPAILEAVREERADLVAMSSHGWTGAARWAYGSVAEAVMRHCPCPVLLVRTAEPARAKGTREAACAAGKEV